VAEIVDVYGREFRVGKPRIQHYLSTLRLIKDLIKGGYEDELAFLMGEAQGRDVSATEFVFFLLDLLDGLDEAYLTRLTAILLQGDIDKTIAFIEENGGVEPSVFMEAFAINCEQADIVEVTKFFRRALKAIRGWSAGEGTDEGDAG